MHLVQADFLRDAFAGRLAVAGQHDRPANAHFVQIADRLLRIALDFIGDYDITRVFAVHGHVNHRADVIDRIGLRVKGNDNNYSLLVGKLEINDNSTVTPANVRDVMVEVKEETKTSMGAKIYWDVNAVATTRAAWGLVYNDEANIDHFEILYKNGENGRVSEIGRTTSWSTYVGNIMFESAADQPFIGVRAVSTDLKT